MASILIAEDRPVDRLFLATLLAYQGHGILVPSYQLDKIKREFAWIEKYVMGRSLAVK